MADVKAFISYRRSDSQAATGRLYDRLNAAYPGRFFRDVSGIGVGVDFVKEIERAVGSSVALIAVIGPTWATAEEAGRKRLDDPEDFVRIEVSTAIQRGIRIVPVLVSGAAMPREDQLPDVLRGLRRWNAVQLVEEYYEEGIERLIDALRPDLGDPIVPGTPGQLDTERRVRELRGEAEAAIAVEDWFAGVQALQSAVSLDPNNRELGARLRWAHEQRKVSGLFSEGQELYEQGKKSAALGRFRQVKVAAGNYRNVGELIAQLEAEVAGDNRRSTVRRWTAGAVAAVVGVVGVVGIGIVWAIKSEFAAANETGIVDTSGGAPQPALESGLAANNAPAPRPSAVDPPEPAPAREELDDVKPEPPPAGIGFPARGRWRMTSRFNPSLSIVLDLQPGGSFQVSVPAGVMSFPLSGGSYQYDPSSGMLQIMGVNNLGGMFREIIHVFEREDDHFHANYSNAVWELTAGD
jgi:hypothetical protein